MGFLELSFQLFPSRFRLTRVCQQPFNRLLRFATLVLGLLESCFNLDLFRAELTGLSLRFGKSLLACGQLLGGLLQLILEFP